MQQVLFYLISGQSLTAVRNDQLWSSRILSSQSEISHKVEVMSVNQNQTRPDYSWATRGFAGFAFSQISSKQEVYKTKLPLYEHVLTVPSQLTQSWTKSLYMNPYQNRCPAYKNSCKKIYISKILHHNERPFTQCTAKSNEARIVQFKYW